MSQKLDKSLGMGISIHAPRKGERPYTPTCPILPLAFQSTLPARGSDNSTPQYVHRLSRFQSTLPARGSDGSPASFRHTAYGFQSTLPARGSDIIPSHSARDRVCNFNPRSPQGGATRSYASPPFTGYKNFNPRSPQGGATSSVPLAVTAFFKFQSTLPARGSDCRA